MAETGKKCLVGVKHAITDNAHSYGYVFDHLEKCCDKFEHFFHDTGNAKIPNFNYRETHNDMRRPGCHLESQGGEMVVTIFFEKGPSVAFSGKLDFCPFCGAIIEVKTVKSVMLVTKKKEVFDRYEEQDIKIIQ